MKATAKRFAIVFGLWTLVAICGGAADYLFLYVIGKAPHFLIVFRRPLTEQWIWAALTPLVFLIARRFPLSKPALLRAAAVHTACFLLLSLLHCTLAGLVGGPLAAVPADYHGSLLKLRFLEEIYSDIWMYWPLVCIQALLDSHASARERDNRAARLEALLATSRLTLLRAQIQPHFLFNTLNGISALLRTDARAAEDMLADLAEILRASFSDPTSQQTTLRRELDLVGCYVRIQTCRFGDRMTVVYQIDPQTLDALVPALVLQSLVENAVIHGIAPLDRRGMLTIQSYRSDERLVLRVDDDGVGLRESTRVGVGLSNARDRLLQLYGNEQSLHLAGGPEGGASAMVCIPFRSVLQDVKEGWSTHENANADRGRRSAGAAQPVVSVGT